MILLVVCAQAGAIDYAPIRISAGSGDNVAIGAGLYGLSKDGSRAILLTSGQLTLDDADANTDLYERAGGLTTRLTTGPAGGNGPFDAALGGGTARVSDDGVHVFFETREQLTVDDTDNQFDVYERAGGVTTLVSIGPTGGNGPFEVVWDGASADGTRVGFSTAEPLTADDTDTELDVYQRAGGVTTRMSDGPLGGNGAFTSAFRGMSADGSRVWFHSTETLTNDDLDTSTDVYEHAGGVTRRISGAPGTGNGAFHAFLIGGSSDGHVLFTSEEQLAPEDTDASSDLYEKFGGSVALVSTGPAGGNGAFNQGIAVMSRDGSRVFFTTEERLTADDTDAANDSYERSGGVTTLVSTGPLGGNGTPPAVFVGASADGSHAFFSTAERMTVDDLDATIDIYERAGGVTTLVSIGPTGGNGAFFPTFARVSDDGARVFFETAESLVPADNDVAGMCRGGSAFEPCRDVYVRAGGETSLVSGPAGGGGGVFTARLASASADGSRAFFATAERITPDDTDDVQDIFEAVPVQAGASAAPVGADTAAPTVSSLGMLRRKFRVGPGRTPVSARRKKRAQAGSAFRYTLSEAASVRIAIERREAGRRVGRRCRKATAKLRKRRRCTRYVSAGTLTRDTKAGANSTSFSGRVGRRALRPARYRVSLVATDKAGNRSRVRRTTFTIVRR